MTTKALARPSTFAFGNGFGLQPVMYRKDSGKLKMERVAVFRSGTFRDSYGDQATWESLHIQQFVENYKHLRDSKVFDDVPVRDGHPNFILNGLPGNGRVVGWHTNLFTEKLKSPIDGEEYDYLLADFEITEPDAADKIERGTWRNRSSEVGGYRTNSEAEFWPVYLGFAYVDMPAVEGLKFSSPNGAKLFMMIDKETSVGQPNPPTAPGQAAPVTQTGTLPFAIAGAATPQVYAINGQQVTDPVAVQTHITSLERFRTETQEGNRRAFVTGLASANKIVATQMDSLTQFALGLTPEQFEQWKSTFGDTPTPSLLGQHGQTVTNSNNAAEQNNGSNELQIARETVKAHKMAGTPVAAIKETASYKKLVAAGQTVDV